MADADAATESLADVLQRLDSFNDDHTIYVVDEPPTADTPAYVGLEGSEPVGWSYLLEVDLARDVLDVWRGWRDQREPSREDAVAAVVYYATNDAYLPTDEA